MKCPACCIALFVLCSSLAHGSALALSVNQPTGALSGRIVYTSGGHGWVKGANWYLQRGVLVEMNEDYGNIDQTTLFAYYCFNAGATVVPLRPIGFQTNAVILDNVSPAVTFGGDWSDETSEPVYYGQPGQVRFRKAAVSATETATATYTPNIPVAGFYPVYTWVPHGADRTNQLYRIRHTGGESLVRVPHHMVGNGWVYLGSYFFNAGSDTNGAVVISNWQPAPAPGSVVVADAIRFGNGMSDSGSTYPREDEGARWWIAHSLGQGQSTSIYSFPGDAADIEDRKARPRMVREMNREAAGPITKRVYISFHSNATTGNTNTAMARGALGLYHTVNPTPNQYRLGVLMGSEVGANMATMNSQMEFSWVVRGSSEGGNILGGAGYHEIDNTHFSGEMAATIIEVAFHDNVQDATLMRDSKVRNWIARASYNGVMKYFNEFDAAPLNYLPEPPTNVRAFASTSGDIAITWARPVNIMSSGNPTGYVVYRSRDGYGFGEPVSVSGVNTTNLVVTGLPAGTDFYFRVTAVNAGGESMASETAGCRAASVPSASKILFVNGFTRFDRTTNVRQTPTVGNWSPPGPSGTMERVLPQYVNAFNYVVQHGKAISAAGVMPFDSCHRTAVLNGTVRLTNYSIVIWGAGQEMTNVLNSAAQNLISNYLANGGHLFISGADVAWSLGRSSASFADKAFLQNNLRVTLASDAHHNSQTRSFTPAAGGIFAGRSAGAFDDGRSGIYCVQLPDVLTPSGAGVSVAMNYSGGIGGAAAIQYDGSAGGGKVVFWGFPFEAVTAANRRNEYMADILKFLAAPPAFVSAALADEQVRMTVSAEPGFSYRIQTSTNLTDWTLLTERQNPDGMFEVTDDLSPAHAQRFYRAVRQ